MIVSRRQDSRCEATAPAFGQRDLWKEMPRQEDTSKLICIMTTDILEGSSRGRGRFQGLGFSKGSRGVISKRPSDTNSVCHEDSLL